MIADAGRGGLDPSHDQKVGLGKLPYRAGYHLSAKTSLAILPAPPLLRPSAHLIRNFDPAHESLLQHCQSFPRNCRIQTSLFKARNDVLLLLYFLTSFLDEHFRPLQSFRFNQCQRLMNPPRRPPAGAAARDPRCRSL